MTPVARYSALLCVYAATLAFAITMGADEHYHYWIGLFVLFRWVCVVVSSVWGRIHPYRL